MKKTSIFIRILITTVIISILMSVTSISLYKTVAQPEFYKKFISLGNHYLEKEMYNEAILEFNKAIAIEEKSTEARIGSAKGNIGLGNIDTAVELLREAQSIDKTNRDMTMEIVDILRDVAPDEAYKILQEYVDEVGRKNVDSEITKLLDSASSIPSIPDPMPESGEYADGFTMKLEEGKTALGQKIYYTTDGSTPNTDSAEYTGSIRIDDSTTVKLIGYNVVGETSDIIEIEYIIENSIKTTLETLITESKDLLDSATEGTDPGNYKPGSKNNLMIYIESSEEVLSQEIIPSATAEEAITELQAALDDFEKSIISNADKSKLKIQIDKSESAANSATEGNRPGQYKSGAKRDLQNAINSAKNVYEDASSTQEEIDNATNELINATNSFKNKTVTSEDLIVTQAGAKEGAVTVSLLWSTEDDLDLQVTSPNGETISLMNKTDSYGGTLDLDAQSLTFVDNPVENIFWKNAPRGTYTVTVKMSSDRNSGAVPFKIRTLTNGETKLYSGNITSGTVTVCSFTY